MVLTGAYYRDNGDEVQVRGTWKPMPDGVQETAVTSLDAGKSWKPWFDLRFRPRTTTGRPPDSEDARAVAMLDEQYQAAVKANDVAIMDKILADDFVLVTGTGRVLNKQALLQEARSRESIYEQQEDIDRTVRLWGDYAVVTAKLQVKGTSDGKPVTYALWFSDTYVRTPAGWRYVFGQASLPLPPR